MLQFKIKLTKTTKISYDFTYTMDLLQYNLVINTFTNKHIL